MKKTYNIKGVLEIVSDDEYYYFIQTSRVCRYNKAFKKDNFIKIKNPCHVVSDVSLNLVVVVNTESIVNMYSYDNLELLYTYKLQYDYQDCKYDFFSKILYLSTYNSDAYINKLWSINLITKKICDKSMNPGYIYKFIDLNPNQLTLAENKIDPYENIISISKVDCDFEMLDNILLPVQSFNDFINGNLWYNCRSIFDLSDNNLHVLSNSGINEKILYIKYINNKYFLWSIWNMHILDSDFKYIKTFKSKIQYLNIHFSGDKFLVTLDDHIECYDSIEEYLFSE